METDMKTLQAYVKRENDWRMIFKAQPLSLDTASDRQKVADNIDSKLSPENLTCDGELSRAEVNRRYRELTAVAKELKALDPNVRMYEFA